MFRNFSWCFVCDFSAVTKPLTTLSAGRFQWCWNLEKSLINYSTTAAVLQLPDPQRLRARLQTYAWSAERNYDVGGGEFWQWSWRGGGIDWKGPDTNFWSGWIKRTWPTYNRQSNLICTRTKVLLWCHMPPTCSSQGHPHIGLQAGLH